MCSERLEDIYLEETRRKEGQLDIRIKLAYERYMCVHCTHDQRLANWPQRPDRQIDSMCMPIASLEMESIVDLNSLRFNTHLNF